MLDTIGDHQSMRTPRALVPLGGAVLGLVALIVVSPWLIGPMIGRPEGWRTLADVGQTYGGISAMLSGLAFCGIAVSLLLQWRQVYLTQMLITRERHFELVKLGLERPNLSIPAAYGTNEVEIEKAAYFNLWVAHWAFLWDTRSIGPVEARHLFDTLFRDEAALAWWAEVGPMWSTTPGRRRRILMSITRAAYGAARDARSSVTERPRGTPGHRGDGAALGPDEAGETSSPTTCGGPAEEMPGA